MGAEEPGPPPLDRLYKPRKRAFKLKLSERRKNGASKL
jgi:hypothetical protein